MLKVNDITITYHNKVIVNNLSFYLLKGEIGCLLGPSGEGKTSILRAIAGLHQINQGSIIINDLEAANFSLNISPQQRKVGMLFQDYALFPHLNVEQNVGFGIKKQPYFQNRVNELLDMVHMEHAKYKYPHELSGGQQQRVALARALAPQPQLLLLDEPFSSLDSSLREELAKEVRSLIKYHNITALLVTHDQAEAFAMVDKVGVLYQKIMQQWDTPYDLYHKPKTPWLAGFIGKGVFINGYAQNEFVDIELGRLKHNSQLTGKVKVLLRADDIIHDDNSSTKAVVISKNFYGADFLYTLQLNSGQQIYAYVPSHHNHDIGEAIGIYLDITHVMLFDNKSVV
jgi:iron(III) transport system ATP-binding protein